MKIKIISGSHRKDSQSFRISNFLKERCKAVNEHFEVEIINLAEQEIPFWEEGVWSNTEKWQKLWGPVKEKLSEADGLILVSPEWGGMVPSKLKNFLILCGADIVGHKPGLIVTVSSGMGGAYPVSELRLATKNNKICLIPEHIVLRQVTTLFNKEGELSELEETLRNRIDFTINLFHKYCKGLQLVRSSGLNFGDYPYGM